MLVSPAQERWKQEDHRPSQAKAQDFIWKIMKKANRVRGLAQMVQPSK
jgi:hypothetical protein